VTDDHATFDIYLKIPGERLTQHALPDAPAVGDTIVYDGRELAVVARQWHLDSRKIVISLGHAREPTIVECGSCKGTGSVSVPTQGAECCLRCNGAGLVVAESPSSPPEVPPLVVVPPLSPEEPSC
jgi:hypothetical protein